MVFVEPGVQVVVPTEVWPVTALALLAVVPASAPEDDAVGAATVATDVGTVLVEAGPQAARARDTPTSAPFQGKRRRLCRESEFVMLTFN